MMLSFIWVYSKNFIANFYKAYRALTKSQQFKFDDSRQIIQQLFALLDNYPKLTKIADCERKLSCNFQLFLFISIFETFVVNYVVLF